MEEDSGLLDNISSIKAGLKAYEAGKGTPEQTRDDAKNRPYDYNYQVDENTYKYLDGRNVGRFYLQWTGRWLKYGDHLAAPRTIDIFRNPKIIIREITGNYPRFILTTYSNEPYLFNMSNIAINENVEANVS